MDGIIGELVTWLRMRPKLLGQASIPRSIEELPPNLRSLAEKYRGAIANVLGVPPEAIREDMVVKWVTEWARAFVKPEYQHMLSLG